MKFRRETIRKTQTLGERIKRVRRKKKISLAKMEGLTKIRSRYLEAIERGEYQRLPGDIYVKGFLRTIAKTLNMDGVKLVNLYQEEIRGTKDQKTVLDRMRGITEAKFIITPKIIFIFFGLLAVFLIGGYFWYQVSGFAAAPELSLAKPTKEDFTTKSDEIAVAGTTDPGTTLTINDQPIKIDLDGNFSENIKLKSGVNQIVIVAKNKIGKQVTKTIKVLSKAPETQKQILGSKNSKLLNFIVEIGPNPAWISIDIDGKNIYQGIILANTSQEFVAKKEIILTTGNAGSTHVYLNGNDLGVVGDEGQYIENQKYNLSQIKKGAND